MKKLIFASLTLLLFFFVAMTYNNFVQKSINIDDINISNEWAFIEFESEGIPGFIRLNTGVKKIVGDNSYPHLIGITIPLKNQQENGLPTPEENLNFNKIEDEIAKLFQKDNKAFLCVTITSNWLKDFLIYSSNDQNINKKMKILKSQFTEYNFEYYTHNDKNWDIYKGYLEYLN